MTDLLTDAGLPYAEYTKANVELWKIRAHSPDLNPVERFWSWLRRKLRAMGLADAVKGRPVLSKQAYKARVARVLRTRKAQAAAACCARGLRRACRQVIRQRGAGIKG